MKSPLQELDRLLEESKKYLAEKKDLSVQKLGQLRQHVADEFEEVIQNLEERRNLTKEAIAHKLQLKRFKVGIWSYLFHPMSFRHLLAAPFIYAMIIPATIMHLFLFIYQNVFFRLCKIPLVKSGDHIVIDRQYLSYLNGFEKFNCMYCGYFNGVVSYCREISGRTERYWCPIKHAKRVWEPHGHYETFFDYLDAEGYREKRLDLRKYEEVKENKGNELRS